MRIVTPERVATSVILWGAGADEEDVFDFQFGADEGLVINHVFFQLDPGETFVDLNFAAAMGLSLDADATAADLPGKVDKTVIDSPLVASWRREIHAGVDDGAGGGVMADLTAHYEHNFRDLPVELRPKTIDNLIHLVDVGATWTGSSIIILRYQLVQFTLSELGILNAFRRF